MENKCVCCNAPIPEGRQVCYKCEHTNNSTNIPKAFASYKARIIRKGRKN